MGGGPSSKVVQRRRFAEKDGEGRGVLRERRGDWWFANWLRGGVMFVAWVRGEGGGLVVVVVEG